MANPVQHASVPKVHMHDPYRWIVADESARLALTTTAADLNKWAKQSSDDTVWELTSSGPNVWVHVAGLEGINDSIASVEDGLAGHIESTAAHASENITYDGTESGSAAVEVKGALDDIYSQIGDIATALDGINGEVV